MRKWGLERGLKTDKARSKEIDRQIGEDSKKLQKEAKVLLLGTRDSEKSTVLKVMRARNDGFSHSEREGCRETVYHIVLDSAQAIITIMRERGIECSFYLNRILADEIMGYTLEETNAFTLSPEIADAIHQFLSDPVVKTVIAESNNKFKFRSTPYFFSEVLRIGYPHYLPTITDSLQPGVIEKIPDHIETRISMGPLSLCILDASDMQCDRRKLLHCFEGVISMIFCVSLAEYDQVSPSINQMMESILLFETIVNSRWFIRTSVILFFTKVDEFKAKLPEVPLERYFPEYTGGNDVNKAAKYILWKFMQTNQARLSIYPHLTQAYDNSNIRLIASTIKETILQNALKNKGIL